VNLRQHVNPFKASLQKQAPTPDWKTAFASAKPLCVDIGCGGGRFDLLMVGTDGWIMLATSSNAFQNPPCLS